MSNAPTVDGRDICLVLLCGLPGVGKSTIVRAIFKVAGGLGIATNVIDYDELTASIAASESSVVGLNSSSRSLEKPPNSWSVNAWRESRVHAFSKCRSLIQGHYRDALVSESPGTSAVEATSEKCTGRKKRIILLDDNFFYASMRKPFYRLARQERVGYYVLYVTATDAVALARNAARATDIRVNDDVYERMKTRFQPPLLVQAFGSSRCSNSSSTNSSSNTSSNSTTCSSSSVDADSKATVSCSSNVVSSSNASSSSSVAAVAAFVSSKTVLSAMPSSSSSSFAPTLQSAGVTGPSFFASAGFHQWEQSHTLHIDNTDDDSVDATPPPEKILQGFPSSSSLESKTHPGETAPSLQWVGGPLLASISRVIHHHKFWQCPHPLEESEEDMEESVDETVSSSAARSSPSSTKPPVSVAIAKKERNGLLIHAADKLLRDLVGMHMRARTAVASSSTMSSIEPFASSSSSSAILVSAVPPTLSEKNVESPPVMGEISEEILLGAPKKTESTPTVTSATVTSATVTSATVTSATVTSATVTSATVTSSRKVVATGSAAAAAAIVNNARRLVLEEIREIVHSGALFVDDEEAMHPAATREGGKLISSLSSPSEPQAATATTASGAIEASSAAATLTRLLSITRALLHRALQLPSE